MTSRILLAIILVVPQVTFGQLYLGARAGYGISSVSFTPTQKEKSLLDQGFDAGLSIKYFDLQYLGLQTDLSFTQRGYRKPIGDSLNYKRVNTYLELPMYMQVKFESRRFFMHFNVGCYGAWLLSSIEGDTQTGSYQMADYEFNILRDNRFDYGLAGVFGFGHESTWGSFQIDFRYFYGLADLYMYNYQGNPSQSPSQVQNISFSYYINLSKFTGKRIDFERDKIRTTEIND